MIIIIIALTKKKKNKINVYVTYEIPMHNTFYILNTIMKIYKLNFT